MEKRANMKETLLGDEHLVQFTGKINYQKKTGSVFLPEKYVRRKRPRNGAYNINVDLSDQIALDRIIPDDRPGKCKDIIFGDTHGWPTTSIVIPFYNEVLSSLIRTCYSVLNHTAEHLLKEIILVDDASTNSDMGELLDHLLQDLQIPKVRLHRIGTRQGLMRTRQAGADAATGDIIVFQDSHCENNPGWLEPIVSEFMRNPKILVQPSIRSIDNTTLRVLPSKPDARPRTTFAWNVRMVWMDPHPGYDVHSIAPYHVPSLVGCAFAIGREFFEDIGSFDIGMNLWGAENHEVPFRVWQCGGEVVTHPCSIVAHTFRPHHYDLDDNNMEILRNTARVAEIWFGKYLPFFYAASIYRTNHHPLTDTDMKSIEDRKHYIYDELKCESNLDVMIDKAFRDMPRPPLDATCHGNLVKVDGAKTACATLKSHRGGGTLLLDRTCHPRRLMHASFMTLTKDGELVWESSNHCLVVEDRDNRPTLISITCDGTQVKYGSWSFIPTGGQIQTYPTGVMQFTIRRDSIHYTSCLTSDASIDPQQFGNNRHSVDTLSVRRCPPLDSKKRPPNTRGILWAWTYHFKWDQVREQELKLLSQFDA